MTQPHLQLVGLRLNPHSAPPGVTIGNFGFLNTLKDNFYTKMSIFTHADKIFVEIIFLR